MNVVLAETQGALLIGAIVAAAYVNSIASRLLFNSATQPVRCGFLPNNSLLETISE